MKRSILLALVMVLPVSGADDVRKLAKELERATSRQVPAIIGRLARIGSSKAFDLIIKAAVAYPSAKSADPWAARARARRAPSSSTRRTPRRTPGRWS